MNPNHEILVFSQCFAPSIGGTPTVMRQLLEALPAAGISVLSLEDREIYGLWPAAYRQSRLPRPGRFWRRLDRRHWHLFPMVIWQALRLLPSKRPAAILAIYPGSSFLLAAWM
jgi:hypothetical protein